MDWAEADALLWLAIVLALIYWGARALISWLNASGVLPDSFTHGALNFIP